MKIKELNIVKAILAGFMIGIGGYAYTSQENPYIGAFLFSIGLITVILYKLPLYTGRIAFITKHGWGHILYMLVGNFFGAAICGIILPCNTQEIVSNKLSQSPIETLFLAIGCGLMIYLAVVLYQHTTSLFAIVLPVMVFILSGFEHCIADMYYFVSTDIPVSLRSLAFIILVITGNSIGAIIPYHILRR